MFSDRGLEIRCLYKHSRQCSQDSCSDTCWTTQKSGFDTQQRKGVVTFLQRLDQRFRRAFLSSKKSGVFSWLFIFIHRLYHECVYLYFESSMCLDGGTRWGSWLKYCATRLWVGYPMVSLEFFIDIIIQSHYGPRVDSASNRNEYQEYFLGVKAAGA